MHPLTFVSPFINPIVLKPNAHDDDIDKETIANFASLGKKESSLVSKYFTHLFKPTAA
jgi:hypothetical protein